MTKKVWMTVLYNPTDQLHIAATETGPLCDIYRPLFVRNSKCLYRLAVNNYECIVRIKRPLANIFRWPSSISNCYCKHTHDSCGWLRTTANDCEQINSLLITSQRFTDLPAIQKKLRRNFSTRINPNWNSQIVNSRYSRLESLLILKHAPIRLLLEISSRRMTS